MAQVTEGLHAMDAISGLRAIPDNHVDCVVTSPPYWDCRDYGPASAKWGGGERCVLGREPTIDEYLTHLLEVFDELKRVLKPAGTLWVNLGDVYWSGSRCVPMKKTSPGQSNSDPTTKPSSNSATQSSQGTIAPDSLSPPYKSLCVIPERFALAMVGRSWVLRNRIVWHKPNHLPASVKDRFASTWEYLFLFAKSSTYDFQLDPIRIPHKSQPSEPRVDHDFRQSMALGGRRLPPRVGDPQSMHPKGKNPGDCWSIPLRPSRHKHTAAFPEALCVRPILAGCPEGGTVLDPFVGSGTSAVVAKRLGRRFIGFDSNPAYIKLAMQRLSEITENETATAQPS